MCNVNQSKRTEATFTLFIEKKKISKSEIDK